MVTVGTILTSLSLPSTWTIASAASLRPDTTILSRAEGLSLISETFTCQAAACPEPIPEPVPPRPQERVTGPEVLPDEGTDAWPVSTQLSGSEWGRVDFLSVQLALSLPSHHSAYLSLLLLPQSRYQPHILLATLDTAMPDASVTTISTRSLPQPTPPPEAAGGSAPPKWPGLPCLSITRGTSEMWTPRVQCETSITVQGQNLH